MIQLNNRMRVMAQTQKGVLSGRSQGCQQENYNNIQRATGRFSRDNSSTQAQIIMIDVLENAVRATGGFFSAFTDNKSQPNKYL